MTKSKEVRKLPINPHMSDLVRLLANLESCAKRTNDGHLTIYRFTTGWKVVLGTPFLDADDYEALLDMPGKMTLFEAIDHAALEAGKATS